MVVTHEEIRRTPQNPRSQSRQTVISNQQNREDPQNNGEIRNNMFSPTFKSVAEMAGWDEEALLLASLVVEDTPEREKNASNRKKRGQLLFKTPPSNSRRKRRAQRRSPAVVPVTVLNLDDDEDDDNGSSKKRETEKKKKTVSKAGKIDAKKLVVEEDKQAAAGESSAGASCSNSTIPDMAKLREELSCAICLEVCFEPSTTPCGHSFCKKCLRSAADKCGKRCPKCRQLISNGRSCTVNTVLWNTIQLLFPKEVEARKAAGVLNGRESQSPVIPTATRRRQQQHHNNSYQTRPVRGNGLSRRSVRGGDDDGVRSSNTRRIVVANEDEDAALALRLQREEFMVENRGGRRTTNGGSSFSSAREALRAIASRASSLRNSRPM